MSETDFQNALRDHCTYCTHSDCLAQLCEHCEIDATSIKRMWKGFRKEHRDALRDFRAELWKADCGKDDCNQMQCSHSLWADNKNGQPFVKNSIDVASTYLQQQADDASTVKQPHETPQTPLERPLDTNTPNEHQETILAAAKTEDLISHVNAIAKKHAIATHHCLFSLKYVSWDDSERGTHHGEVSCIGNNITDTTIRTKEGRQNLLVLRADNWDELLGYDTLRNIAVIVGNHNNSALHPVTLEHFLQNAGEYGKYAGIPEGTDLTCPETSEMIGRNGQAIKDKEDEVVSIRFQTVFVPTPTDASPVDFCSEAFNYQTKRNDQPRNLLLLATSQGTAVQQDGRGRQKLFHHAVDPSASADKQICRHWIEAESTEHKVGGAQLETTEEHNYATSRGKAGSSVIGTRGMGTRFNTLMTIQVPIVKQTNTFPNAS
ncbi:MAG TPA: hypothetical protein EYO59_11710, partial [Chromatiaceae bacterium]|nr:hypothetical protein [Chromatiaceae bacterium]